MTYKFFLVDAFTNQLFYGNPAGVVVLDEHISEDMMLKIAQELKVSEVAYVCKLNNDEFDIKFFTSVEEVELCGHATIASFFALAENGFIPAIEKGIKKVFQHTKAGKLAVYLEYNNFTIIKVIMEQGLAVDFGKVKDINKLSKSLGIDVDDIGLNFTKSEPRIISTGIKDIMLPLKTREVLSNINMDLDLVLELCEDEKCFSIHAFTMDNADGVVFQRNFAPILGIDEEAATGTSTGALLYFLRTQDITKQSYLHAVQGIEMKRPSDIFAEYHKRNDRVEIRVGGEAKVLISGEINI